MTCGGWHGHLVDWNTVWNGVSNEIEIFVRIYNIKTMEKCMWKWKYVYTHIFDVLGLRVSQIHR